jgi:hypothetical protein
VRNDEILHIHFTRSLHEEHERNALWAGRLSVRLSACFNSRTTGRIRMKFGMEVVPLGTTPKSYF